MQVRVDVSKKPFELVLLMMRFFLICLKIATVAPILLRIYGFEEIYERIVKIYVPTLESRLKGIKIN